MPLGHNGFMVVSAEDGGECLSDTSDALLQDMQHFILDRFMTLVNSQFYN
jgi:hypothetical protein